MNRKRNVSSVTNNIANGVVSWSVLPRTTVPDAELFPSESNEFLTFGGMAFKTILFVFFFFKSFIPIMFHLLLVFNLGKSQAKDVATFERRTQLRQYDPSGESISPLVNIVAKTIINEDGNITEQHMPYNKKRYI